MSSGPKRKGPEDGGSRLSAPARDIQNYAVAGDVVLNAHVEVVSRLVEDPASPFGGQIIEVPIRTTSVRQEPSASSPSSRHRPQIIVATDSGTVAVFMDDPVPASGLVRHIVHHREIRRSDN